MGNHDPFYYGQVQSKLTEIDTWLLQTLSHNRPDTLYHYTDAAGLTGIVNSGNIWATHYQYLNDPSEFSHGQNLVSQALAKLKKQPYKDQTKEIIESCIHQLELPYIHATHGLYIVSFSAVSDQLGQWRGYADNGRGYEIGFNSAHLSGLYRMVYAPSEQIEIAEFALKNYLGTIDSTDSSKLLRGIWQGIESQLLQLIERLIVYFKHESYKEEREWRLHRSVFRSAASNLLDHATPLFPLEKVCFRTKEGLPMPYVKIPFPEDLPPIIEVLIGPAQNEDRAKKSIELLLSHKGFHPDNMPKIEKSTIPYA